MASFTWPFVFKKYANILLECSLIKVSTLFEPPIYVVGIGQHKSECTNCMFSFAGSLLLKGGRLCFPSVHRIHVVASQPIGSYPATRLLVFKRFIPLRCRYPSLRFHRVPFLASILEEYTTPFSHLNRLFSKPDICKIFQIGSCMSPYEILLYFHFISLLTLKDYYIFV